MSSAAHTGDPAMATMRPSVPPLVPQPAGAGATGGVTDVTAEPVGNSSALDNKPDARANPPAQGQAAAGQTPQGQACVRPTRFGTGRLQALPHSRLRRLRLTSRTPRRKRRARSSSKTPRPPIASRLQPSRLRHRTLLHPALLRHRTESMSRILLADDSPHAQRMGERILREEGFEVVSLTDGNAVMARLADVDPDVIMADVFLPGKSGFELCRYVKNEPRFKHVRVVLTAGLLEPFDEDEAKRTGCDAIIKKPFEASRVVGTIDALVKDAQQARGSPTGESVLPPPSPPPLAEANPNRSCRSSPRRLPKYLPSRRLRKSIPSACAPPSPLRSTPRCPL